jgi:hypothetical protein
MLYWDRTGLFRTKPFDLNLHFSNLALLPFQKNIFFSQSFLENIHLDKDIDIFEISAAIFEIEKEL